METVKAVKSVSIPHQPSEEVLRLLRDFRSMVNHCLEVGLREGVTGRFKLTKLVYGKLSKLGYHSWYALSAIETATAILKNYRKAKKRNPNVKLPQAKRLNRFNGKIQEISIRNKEIKRRLNNWWFRKFLHMANYKCLWFGVKVKPVNPKGSSSICPRCGSKLKLYPMGHTKCIRCGLKRDRHVIACLNLLKTSDVRVWFALERPSNVAMNPALTSPISDEDKLGEPKRGSLVGMLDFYNIQFTTPN